MECCLLSLKDLSKEKDQEVEAYLEEFAEEKVSANLEIKMKYSKMTAMLKKGGADEEKLAALEEKKKGEEYELQSELADRKTK